jgi:hypothetical protein
MQCHRIHAVAQARGLRAIIKDMAQMGIAMPARDRIALHADAVV